MEKNGSMVELIQNDLAKKEDLSCSETILHAANRVYRLNLSPKALKLAAGFGGGMGVQKTCGALTGGLMALSALFIRERAHESDYLKGLEKELFRDIEARVGSTDCSYLKERYEDSEGSCKPLIIEIGAILEALIDRELAKAGRA
jgi:C_GCAxxG_C_C family probable redox protein